MVLTHKSSSVRPFQSSTAPGNEANCSSLKVYLIESGTFVTNVLSGTGDSQRDLRESIRANHSQLKPLF